MFKAKRLLIPRAERPLLAGGFYRVNGRVEI